MENDNKKGGLGEHVDFGARGLNTWTGKFYGIDPLWAKYPSISPYAFVMNNPIINIDKDGREVYYAADGTFLGKIGGNTTVMIVNSGSIKSVRTMIAFYNDRHCDAESRCNDHIDRLATNLCIRYANDRSTSLGVDEELLLAFAAVIDNESGGSKGESYRIGNITHKYIDNGGNGSDLTTLEDVVMYDNSFAQGATQAIYSDFMTKNRSEHNKKFGVGGAINAIGYSKKIPGFKDYAGSANRWDGLDLILTKTLRAGAWVDVSNNHRGYTWSENSKSLLQEYINKYGTNYVVDINKWTFKKTGYQYAATEIVGKTLFEMDPSGVGGKKQSTSKFQLNNGTEK